MIAVNTPKTYRYLENSDQLKLEYIQIRASLLTALHYSELLSGLDIRTKADISRWLLAGETIFSDYRITEAFCFICMNILDILPGNMEIHWNAFFSCQNMHTQRRSNERQ